MPGWEQGKVQREEIGAQVGECSTGASVGDYIAGGSQGSFCSCVCSPKMLPDWGWSHHAPCCRTLKVVIVLGRHWIGAGMGWELGTRGGKWPVGQSAGSTDTGGGQMLRGSKRQGTNLR